MKNATNVKQLVIVESPTKAKTIRRFLPPSYQVEASMGHVRDLPANAEEVPAHLKGSSWAKFGVNIEDNFAPLYVVPQKKKKIVTELKKALKEADELFIATDEDREGEAIGWHLLEVLKPKVPVKRMVFHEITQEAIQDALNHTRDIDTDLVDAQETRRVLDRLVGYSISPLLWKKIAPKLSAGRVQSVAVRLMVMREKERLSFMPAQYWDLKAKLRQDSKSFEAIMTHLDGVRLATGKDFDADTGTLKQGLVAGKNILLLAKEQAKNLSTSLKKQRWQVQKVEERQQKRSPYPPFTTSTLQQESSRKLGLSARDTMRVAQGLYENGYITYMRTDSINLSAEAVSASRKAVERRYGKEYLSNGPRTYKSKSKNAQEAHEAIRPAGTDMKTASELGLSGNEARLYDLIWKRTVATQMADAILKFVTATLEVGQTQVATFRATGRSIVFPGFFRAYVEGSDDPEAALDDQDQPLPALQKGDNPDCEKLDPQEHETKPPARFTEASLVKLLEQEGIGRPSTYASIIDTVIRRGYVRKQGSALIPTFKGFATNNLLEQQFEQLVDVGFTADMEQVLDDIATGDKESKPYLRDFYHGNQGIETLVSQGEARIDPKAVSTISHPKWEDIIVRVGRYGPYAIRKDNDNERVSLPETVAPADITHAWLEEQLTLGSKEGTIIGPHPESGELMLLKSGPYGPYVQLGESDDDKPRRTSLPKNITPDKVDVAVAARLLSLPRYLGDHPNTGKAIEASLGRFGPYVKHGSLYASLKKTDDVLTIALPRALELIAEKEEKERPLKILGKHPVSGEELAVRKGRWGYVVKHKRIIANLPKGTTPEDVTLEQALALLASKGDNQQSKAKTTKKKAKSTKTKSKKASGPKATAKDLEVFLDELAPADARVVERLEGMRGFEKQDILTITDALELSEEEVKAAHKRGMFKLRMAYGQARKKQQAEAEKAEKAKTSKATLQEVSA